jgi:hypothetical protein
MPQSRSRQTIRPLPPSPPMVVKLPRNGPKNGQSMEAWLYGKTAHAQRTMDALRWRKP